MTLFLTAVVRPLRGAQVGLFEPEAAAWRVEGIPEAFSFGEIPPVGPGPTRV